MMATTRRWSVALGMVAMALLVGAGLAGPAAAQGTDDGDAPPCTDVVEVEVQLIVRGGPLVVESCTTTDAVVVGDADVLVDRDARVDGPVVVIGMDTPQLDPATLSSVVRSVRPGRAVLGPADDGGWWVLGLHRAERHAFDGVPMSADDTGIRQAEQLRRCGLAVDPAPTLRDIDHWPDALAAAAATPGSRLAAAVAEVEASLVVAG